MAQFTLDDIRAAADAKYGPTDIDVNGEVCRLVNVLQLPKERRKALTDLQKRADAQSEAAEAGEDVEESDQVEVLQDSIRIVARSEHEANVLLGALGDNLAVLVQVFETYTSETSAGEA